MLVSRSEFRLGKESSKVDMLVLMPKFCLSEEFIEEEGDLLPDFNNCPGYSVLYLPLSNI
jgi:hypothetical protein